MLGQDIQRILIDQQEEFLNLPEKDEVPRMREVQLLELLPARSIKVILGVRRAGKSVLAARVLRAQGKSIIYVNFDDDRWTDIETKDLQTLYLEILRLKPEVHYWFFDEIQNISSWELFLARLFREKRNIIITGSNGKLLGKDLATHLTGRHLSLEVFPFSFVEFLAFKGMTDILNKASDQWNSKEQATLRALCDTYFEIGGFPEVLRGAPGQRYLRELFDRIISRDLVQRYQLRQSRGLKELALFLFNNAGQRFTYQKLAKNLGFKSVNTVRNYVSYLADGYLLFELEAFSFKVKERISLPRKIYAIDTGMIQALNRKMTPDIGARFENLVYLHLRRNEAIQLSYLKGESFEVDFVLQEGRKVTQLIQVCYSMQDVDTFEREVRGMVQGAQILKCRNLLILSADEERRIEVEIGIHEKGTIHVLPVWKWLLANHHDSEATDTDG